MPVVPVTDSSTQPVVSGTSSWSLGAVSLEEPQPAGNRKMIPKTRIAKGLLIRDSSSHVLSMSSLKSSSLISSIVVVDIEPA
jgi:hypothetical protein